MENNLVLILHTENTSYGKDILYAKASMLSPDYKIVETMCIHNTFEYTEYVFLLRKSA